MAIKLILDFPANGSSFQVGHVMEQAEKTCGACFKSIGFMQLQCVVHLRNVDRHEPACPFFSNQIQFSNSQPRKKPVLNAGRRSTDTVR